MGINIEKNTDNVSLLLNYKNGSKYVGEFRSGTKSGQGNYYFTDGEIWTGLFENGKWISGTKYGPGEAPHDLIQ